MVEPTPSMVVQNDTIVGAGAADSILGGDGADSLTGAAGNDSILGGSGDDTIDAGAGTDSLPVVRWIVCREQRLLTMGCYNVSTSPLQAPTKSVTSASAIWRPGRHHRSCFGW